MSDAAVFAWAKDYANQYSVTALAALSVKYDRSTMSQYLNGKYPAKVEAIEATLRPFMGSRLCPYLDRKITADDCSSRALRPRPHQSGGAMHAHWQACQSCSNKPADKGETHE